uniref:AT-hook motif nuclear-localized protein n=1 Tax=Leersia perrieri TaxID=77586 RepID=A0A0D9W9T7_9ORYZ
MASEENKVVTPNELPMEHTSSSGAKRKRGRPRKYEYGMHELPHSAQPTQSIPPLHSTQDSSNIRQDGTQINNASGGSVGPTIQALPTKQVPPNRSSRQATNYSSAPLQGNSVKDDIVGKYFVGKMSKKFPGFSLITVKVKDNLVLKGWIPDENNLRPITSKDDLAPDLPMLRPSQVRKRPSTIYSQAAGQSIPVPLEDVTFAKPLQMRRPIEKSVTKHMVLSAPRPYMGSGVVAAAPISVAPISVAPIKSESKPFSEQGNELRNPQPLSVAVPIQSGQPVLASCKQDTEQPENTKEAEQLDTKRDISKGVDGSKSEASGGTEPLIEASTATHSPQEIPDGIHDVNKKVKVDNNESSG